MARSIPSHSQQQQVLSEIQSMQDEILSLWLPSLNKTQYPKIALKFGGYTAMWVPMYEDPQTNTTLINCLVIRYDSWQSMTLFTKRTVLIHEIYHSFGMEHSNAKSYGSNLDQFSLFIYEMLWGKDEPFIEMIKNTELLSENVKESVKMLNRRQLKIKALKTKDILI